MAKERTIAVVITMTVVFFGEVTVVFGKKFGYEDMLLNGRSVDYVQNEPRKKQQQDLMSRILPMLATPFILQATLLPFVLIFMKLMLANSLFVGKLAIAMWSFIWFKNHLKDRQSGLYSHNVNVNDDDGQYYKSQKPDMYNAKVYREWERNGNESNLEKEIYENHYGYPAESVYRNRSRRRKR